MRGPGQYNRVVQAVVGMALGSLVAGCATQADLNDQARKLQGMIAAQSRSIEGLREDVERLRVDMAGAGRKRSGEASRSTRRATDKDRLHAPDKTPRRPPSSSEEIGETLAPEGTSTEDH